jgi:hypothetical protein
LITAKTKMIAKIISSSMNRFKVKRQIVKVGLLVILKYP